MCYWRRQWQPIPVLLPGKSHRQRSLVGCSLWGRWESDTIERLHFHFSLSCIGEGKATHSSVLAWRIPGMGEPGGLPSLGSHRVRHNWHDLAAAAYVLYIIGTCLFVYIYDESIKQPPSISREFPKVLFFKSSSFPLCLDMSVQCKSWIIHGNRRSVLVCIHLSLTFDFSHLCPIPWSCSLPLFFFFKHFFFL